MTLLMEVWIFSFLTGFTMSQTLQTSCACYGNDPTVDSIQPSCTDGVIAIDKIYRAAKKTSVGCTSPASDADRDIPNCCTYDAATDCQILLSSADATTSGYFTDCTGVSTCTKTVTWQQTTTECAASFMAFTNFMCIDYYCANNADTMSMCDTSGATLSVSTMYLQNDNYPAAISHTNCCACVITASAASSTIDLNMVDMRLYDSAAMCLQTLFVLDGTTYTNYTCSTTNSFTIINLLTSTTNELTVTLKSDVSASGNGFLWLQAVVSNGGLSMTCGSVSLCPDEAAAAASSSSAASSDTAASSSSSSSSSEDTLLFGQTVTISAILIAGLGLILLLIGGLLGCCCYFCGKSKGSYDTRQKNKQPHRADTSSISDTSPPPSYRTTQSIPHGHVRSDTFVSDDFRSQRRAGEATSVGRKGNMFVYRPFENRNMLHSYKRHESLPRVDSF